MTTRSVHLIPFLCVLTLSAAEQDHPFGYSDTPYLPGWEWRVHDIARPMPRVVSLATQNAVEPPEVERRVPDTYVGISLRLEDFIEDERATERLARELGGKLVLFGSLPRAGATIIVLAEKAGAEHRTSEQWREALTGGEGEAFQVGTIACREVALSTEGLRRVDFNAFPVAAGHCFDVHVSVLSEGEASAFTRRSFVSIVESFRVAFLRRGWRVDYPERVLDIMNTVAVRMPQWSDWLAREAEREPEDYAVPFVLGETLRVLGAPKSRIITAYEGALSLFEALEAPTAREIFAWAVAEDGIGLALASSERLAEAIAHYRHGYELACKARHGVRATLAYNLACALSLSEEAEEALVFLRLAVSGDPRYRDLARRDSDLAVLRGSEEFRRILGEGE